MDGDCHAETAFVAWLRDQLAARDWTDRELAERAGVSSAAVSRWMGGTRTPNASNIARLANALSIESDEVYARLAEKGVVISAITHPTRDARSFKSTVSNLGDDDLPNWLEAELIRRDQSPEDLAWQMGIEATVVRFWLRGLLSPSPHQLLDLAAVLEYAPPRHRRATSA